VVRNEPSINDSRPFPFLFLDGLIADLTPWMRCGGHGTVSGIPNFAPLAGAKLWNLLTATAPSDDDIAEAARIQDILSRADVSAVPAGVRGMSECNLLLFRFQALTGCRICTQQAAWLQRSTTKTSATVEGGRG
jgi:hypothetical protein